ncbi:MAG: PQQ-binding-like beta-propeller repeat protein [Planctomycetes bacterium]|nr:PQQ-binding-like beta-propeller repeat protein [Planctomycetota bacterium]
MRRSTDRRCGRLLLRWLVLIAVVCLPVGQAGRVRGADVYVQDSPAAAELLETARDRVSKGELDEAARMVQKIFDEHGGKLLELGNGSYSESRRVAAKFLNDNPPLRDLYQQLYEPAAKAALSEAGSDPTKLTEVLHRYPLTQSGLEAGLRLAGLALESGAADAASVVLAQLADHPLRGKDELTWNQLQAASAILQGDANQFRASRAMIEKSGNTAALRQLDELAAAVTPRRETAAMTPLDPQPAAHPPTDISKPLWRVDIGGAERYLVDQYQTDRAQIDSAAEEGRYLNILPLVSDSMLFINDAHTLYALEPSSGREIWRRTAIEIDEDTQSVARPYSRWLPYGVDMNLAAVSEDRLVAVCGFSAMVTNYMYFRTPAESQLVCVDARTGKLLWSRLPDEIDNDADGGFWYGRPIVSRGRAYVTLRRRQRTQFQDVYVVAVDLRNGDMLWKRHLASTAMSDRNMVPSLSHMTLREGYLYVDSSLGAVAKVSAADGSIDWLTLVPINEDQTLQSTHYPWDASAPVITAAGVIVYDDWAGLIRVFDPGTGKVTQSFPAARWGSPRYLSKFGSDVLAVGSNVGRFNGRTLDPIWMYESRMSTMVGRAAIAGDQMYLPVGDHLELLNLTDGKLVTRMNVPMPASVLAMDGQLVTVDRTGVSSYSSWAVASEQLHKRAADHPDDARPWMALAWLALNNQRLDTLTDAIDKAVAIVTAQKPGERGGELFDQLLAMTEQVDASNHELRQQLFDRLAAVTSSPDQEVTYRLALAKHFESLHNIKDAIEQYQTILAEPTYRRRLYTHDNGSRQAGLEAQRRLTALIGQAGREAYAPYEAFADQRLKELANQTDAEALIELAEAYPLSTVAPQALMLAAERTASAGNGREAVALLRRASQLTTDEAMLGKLYGRQAELFEAAQQPNRARRVLRSLTAAHPGVQPVRKGQPVDAVAWMKELAQSAVSLGAMTRINPPFTGNVMTFDGEVLEPIQQDPDAMPASTILLRLPEALQLRRATDLSVVWTRPLEGEEEVQLLSMDRNQVWLWYPDSQRMAMLSASDGTLAWHEDEVSQKLAAINAPERARTPQEAQFRRMIGPGIGVVKLQLGGALRQQLEAEPQREPGPMVAISDLAISVVDPRGRIVVFNADNGKVRWQAASIVRKADLIRMDSRYLMICGTDEDEAPLLCVYDANTGQLIHKLLKAHNQNITWMGLTDESELLYISSMQIEAFDLNRGQSMWVSEPGVRMVGADGAWLGSDRLAAMTQDGDLLWIDLADGRVMNRLPLRDTLNAPLTVTSDMDTWMLVGANGCVVAGDDGVVKWRDAVTEPHQFVSASLTDRYVVLLAAPADGQFTDPHARRLYFLDRNGGSIQFDQAISAGGPLYRMNILDGKLLLGGQNVTAALFSAP